MCKNVGRYINREKANYTDLNLADELARLS